MQTVRLKKDAVVVRLPLRTLQAAVNGCPELWNPEYDAGPRVYDVETFAKAVVEELEREEEDGTTLVHRMFDKAFIAAVENGAEGVVCPEDGDHEDYNR